MIDPEKPVYLKRMIIHPTSGNVLPPLKDRPYAPGAIPVRYLTDEYTYQTDLERAAQPLSQIPTTTLGGGVETIPETVIEPTQTLTQPPSDTPPPPSKPLVLINTETAAEIASKLDGVGDKSSAKVVEARGTALFSGIEDLNTRVPLPSGRKWDSYVDQIVFDT